MYSILNAYLHTNTLVFNTFSACFSMLLFVVCISRFLHSKHTKQHLFHLLHVIARMAAVHSIHTPSCKVMNYFIFLQFFFTSHLLRIKVPLCTAPQPHSFSCDKKIKERRESEKCVLIHF